MGILTRKQHDLIKQVRHEQAKGMSLRWFFNKVSPGLDDRVEIYKLDEKNVPKSPRCADSQNKLEGERYFSEAHLLFNRVLPKERDRKDERRRWIFDAGKGDVFFHVAVNVGGNVVGASIATYAKKVNLALFNLIAVDPEYRNQGVAKMLVKHRIWSADEASKKAKKGGIDYVGTEIARPDGKDADNIMRNKIRLEYHQKVSQVKAVLSPENEVLGSTHYMFTIRQIGQEELRTISARKYAKLIYWHYVDYTEWEKLGMTFSGGMDYLARVLNKIAWKGGITGKMIEKEKTRVLERVPKNLELEMVELSKLAIRG